MKILKFKIIRRVYLLFLCTFFLSLDLLAQPLRPVPERITDAKIVGAEFTTIKNLLVKERATNDKITKEENVQYFTYNKEVARDLLVNPQQFISIYLPYKDKSGKDIVLDLFNVSNRRNDYNVITPNGRYERTTLLGQHFSGVVRDKEDNTSIVSISIFENQMMGIVSIKGEGALNIGPTKDKSKHKIFNDGSLKSNPPVESCQMSLGSPNSDPFYNQSNTPLYSEIYSQLDSGMTPNYEIINKCINVYFEVSEQTLNYFYYNETATVDFVVALFHHVATLYLNEGIVIGISDINMLDTNPTYSVVDFANNTPSFNGDLAHLLLHQSGGGAGGKAIIAGLCDNDDGDDAYQSGPYGITKLHPDFTVFNDHSRQVKVLAHEIGHNLGSRHTHACVWNGNNTPIDGCGFYQESMEHSNNELLNGFACTPASDPPEGGTIMSYCDSESGVNVDFTLGFGTQPGYVIRSFVEQLTTECLGACACPYSINHGLNETITTGYFPVEVSIESEANIAPGSTVIYDAGNYITLEDGFLVGGSDSTVFTALIGGCTPTNVSNTLFDTYTWLSGIVNPSDCCAGSTVTEYSNGYYEYILISCNGVNTFYYDNGTVSCQNSDGTCINYYQGQGYIPTGNSWSCPNSSKMNDKSFFDAFETTDFTIAPNPFNDVFNIQYEVLEESPISIDIYNLNGRLLQTVLDGEMHQKGRYTQNINASDLPPGVYLVKLLNGNNQQVKRLVKM